MSGNPGDHTAAITNSGELWVWGRNTHGQLGTGDNTNQSSPVQTISQGTNWRSVTGGLLHTAAIKTDGSLWCWGYNAYGQLGTQDQSDRQVPTQTISEGMDWSLVSAGSYHTAAIKTNGSLWSWGDNRYGQLGDNTETTRFSPVQTVSQGTDWKSVACGGGHTVAIKTNGTLWTWGDNEYGQLGDSTTVNRMSPVQTISGGSRWSSVTGSWGFTSAIKTDGSLWTWGQNTYGQLGTGDTVQRSSPVQTSSGGKDWRQIASGGDHHSAAIKADGSLWTWGRNNIGQLAVPSISFNLTPLRSGFNDTKWKDVSAGNYSTYGIKSTIDQTATRPEIPVSGSLGGSSNIEYYGESYRGSDNRVWKGIKYAPLSKPSVLSFYLLNDSGSANDDWVTTDGTLVVNGFDVTNGSWKYSIDGGTTWSAETLISGVNLIVLPNGSYAPGAVQVVQINAVGDSSDISSNSSAIFVGVAPVTTLTVNAISGDNVVVFGESNVVISGTISGTLGGVASVTLTIGSNNRTATVSGRNWTYTMTQADLENLGGGSNKLISIIGSANGQSAIINTYIEIKESVGQAIFTNIGSFTWSPPPGVTSVCVVCIGGGGAGSGTISSGGGGGGGAGCAYANNIIVTPNTTYRIQVGQGGIANGGRSPTASIFGTASANIVTATNGANASGASRGTGGGYIVDISYLAAGATYGGWNGGAGGAGTSSAGLPGTNGAGSGYIGSAGGGGGGHGSGSNEDASSRGAVGAINSTPSITNTTHSGAGGGGGTIGEGYASSSGSIGDGSNGGAGGAFGGGGGGSSHDIYLGGTGANGAVRIIWGPNRSFPSTRTNAVTS
jgi:alpha-tubulin suppressor-like RCC1 family protein